VYSATGFRTRLVHSLRNRTHKIICRQDNKECVLYDLIKDPEERDNIYEKEDPVSQAMLDKLYHFLGEEGEILDDTIYGKLNISPEAKDRLRELGYLM